MKTKEQSHQFNLRLGSSKIDPTLEQLFVYIFWRFQLLVRAKVLGFPEMPFAASWYRPKIHYLKKTSKIPICQDFWKS